MLAEFAPVSGSSPVAYFSMEVGLVSAMPTYSGGLGVLAGGAAICRLIMEFRGTPRPLGRYYPPCGCGRPTPANDPALIEPLRRGCLPLCMGRTVSF